MSGAPGLSVETLQRLAAERRSHNVVEGLLLETLLLLHRHERETREALANLQRSIDALRVASEVRVPADG